MKSCDLLYYRQCLSDSSLDPGQQQTFRPFFDTRFTSGLLDFRRKSDPFSNVTNEGSTSGYPLTTEHWSGGDLRTNHICLQMYL